MSESGASSFTRNDDPSTGDSGTPNRFDRGTGVSSGAPPEIGGLNAYSHDCQGDTHPLPTSVDWCRSPVEGRHANRKGRAPRAPNHPDRCQVCRQQRATISSRLSRVPAISGGQFVTAAAFATDALTLGERLTINAGVRFDHSRAYQPGPSRARCGRPRNRSYRRGAWHVLHVEPDLATSRRHRQAQRRWPNDLAGKLRAVSPGHFDRRGQLRLIPA